jgi:hypothetical protein
MKALRSADIARVNDEVIESDKALKVERPRVRGHQDADRTDSRLKRAVEGEG